MWKMFGFSSGNCNYLIMLLKIISSSPTTCFPIELGVVVLGAFVFYSPAFRIRVEKYWSESSALTRREHFMPLFERAAGVFTVLLTT